MTQPETVTEERDENEASWSLDRKLHEAILRLGQGKKAQLRRDPITSLTFYELHARLFPRVERDESWRAWGTLVRVGALLVNLYEPFVSLGTALAEARLSEARLSRLLRSDDDRLLGQVYACARFLAAKGQKQDMVGFRELLLSKGEAGERARRRIASDYYRAETRSEETQHKEQ